MIVRLEVYKTSLHLLVSFVVCGAGSQTQGLMHASQALSTKLHSRHSAPLKRFTNLFEAGSVHKGSGYYTGKPWKIKTNSHLQRLQLRKDGQTQK